MIAPESANDAKDGGDLGRHCSWISPRVVTALFIVAPLGVGYLPDLRCEEEPRYHLQAWSGFGHCRYHSTLVGFLLAAQLAKLAQVRYSVMVPINFHLVFEGAFSVNRDPAICWCSWYLASSVIS